MPRDSITPLRLPARSMAAAPARPPIAGRLPLGAAHADVWLGGGLRRNGLHEAYAGTEDGASALGFALLLARLQQQQDGRALIWVREARLAGLPYGPGLAELGLAPAMPALLRLPDSKSVLRAALDSVREGAASAVLIELHGRQPLLDLTATRRLALAAAETGTMVLLVRCAAAPGPSAAHSRWQVASAPSRALEANAPGRPAFDLTLLRQRGGQEGLHLVLEWDRDTASFHERPAEGAAAALSGAVLPLAAGRAGDAGGPRAA